MVSVDDSEPYVTTGRTNVRYICNLTLISMGLLLTSCLFAFFRRLLKQSVSPSLIVYEGTVLFSSAGLGIVQLVSSGRVCD